MKKPFCLLTLFMLLYIAAIAQIDLSNVTNTGILYIVNSTDTFSIKGAFTNTQTASLKNNGNLFISRTITSLQPFMQAGTGTLFLNGSILQAIEGTTTFATHHLVTDNTEGIQLNSNLSVDGIHTFSNGLINTNDQFLIYESDASYVGANDNRHVNGWVKKLGKSDFIFPVGNGTHIRTVSLSSLSAYSEFNCHYREVTPNPLNIVVPVVLVDANEYWDIQKVSGDTATVTLNWNNSSVIFPWFPLHQIRVVNYASNLWNNRGGSATGDIYTSGSISSAPVTSFGFFTLGSLDWMVAQQFLSFTARRESVYSLLEWTTAQETGVQKYEIQRSDDGRSFYGIGNQLPYNTIGTHKYAFKDYKPIQGTAWYRIRNISRNGQYSYSVIVAVTESMAASLYVVNNPVYQNIFLAATGNYAGKYEYVLLTSAGQLIQKGVLTANAGGITTLPLSKMVTPGVYIFDVRNTKHHLSQRLIVR